MYGVFRERTLLHELYLIVPLIVHALRSRDHRTLERVEKGAPEVCVVTGTKTLNTQKKSLTGSHAAKETAAQTGRGKMHLSIFEVI